MALLGAVLGTGPLRAQVAAAEPLAGQVLDVIASGEWHRAHWGIDVRNAATGEEVFSYNADRLFVPASNLKLVVAATAAHHLGGDYRYATSFFATGPITDGVLEGDLVVVGTGDPNFSGRFDRPMAGDLEAFADSLRTRGVRRIAGGVVTDVSAWPDEPLHPDWQNYDMLWWYAAPTGPLGFNDNAIDFTIRPGAPGTPARVTWKPETEAFVFENRSRTVRAGKASDWDLARIPGTDTIYVYGDVAADARAQTEHFAVRDPGAFFATVLLETLLAKGIEVGTGKVRVDRHPVAEGLPERTPLFTYWSRPLTDVIGPILLRSQNWFAEQLLKTLGLEIRSEASWEAGLDVERSFLRDEVGLDTLSFQLRDASGLSAGNLMSPGAMTRLLVHLRGTEAGAVVWDALPVAASADGSLRARFPDLPGRVRAKTGHITNVDSLSGYVEADSGRLLAFSVIVNGTPLSSARTREVIDRVVRILTRM
ncbi:MAG TPA: D-alanyl-D-alanine carboxypeptidase/D-alanyl-D-alanine-endopeptidase [Longimicrobiales bacterium]|nr:D-alanyl-D-alanine carboxypeptidase/D-alanyl-D-alanine-endopeptidase [Longimicrobiales bacterium]